MKCFKALGLDETTEFILGSSFQLNEDYASKVYKLATLSLIHILMQVQTESVKLTR